MNRKPLFDHIRHLLGRGLTQREVEALDDALDDATCPAPTQASDETGTIMPARVSAAGLHLIKSFEGCARLRPDGLYEAYPDPGSGGAPWTIGWGATGKGIGPGTVWTKEQCDARLSSDVARHAEEVIAALDGAHVTQGQFDALVSFHFNTGAIRRASLMRMHREGDFASASREFRRWKFAGGRVMRGLVRRRRAEARLYRG